MLKAEKKLRKKKKRVHYNSLTRELLEEEIPKMEPNRLLTKAELMEKAEALEKEEKREELKERRNQISRFLSKCKMQEINSPPFPAFCTIALLHLALAKAGVPVLGKDLLSLIYLNKLTFAPPKLLVHSNLFYKSHSWYEKLFPPLSLSILRSMSRRLTLQFFPHIQFPPIDSSLLACR